MSYMMADEGGAEENGEEEELEDDEARVEWVCLQVGVG